MDNKKIIGQRINSALALYGYKQKDLAKALNVTDNTISYFCKGSRTPNTIQIIEIAKFLNVSSDYLLGLTKIENTKEDMIIARKTTGLSKEAINNIKNGCFPAKECFNGELIFLMLNSILSSNEIREIIAAMCDMSSIEINNYKNFDCWDDSLSVAFEKLSITSNSQAQFEAQRDDYIAKKDKITALKYRIEENFKKLYLSAIEKLKNSEKPEKYFDFKTPFNNL